MKPSDVTDFDEENRVICVDFDKTLTTGEGPHFWEEDDEEYPNEEMVEWVNEKFREGHVIIVWTARPWAEARDIVAYLTDWEVEFNGIRCDKGRADVYIDDRAVNTDSV